MIFTDNIKLDLIGISVAIITVLLAWCKWTYGYWERKGVPGPKPKYFFGNLKEFLLGKKYIGVCYRELYEEYKAKGARFVGVFLAGSPTLVIVDLNLVKAVVHTDFQNFHSHGTYVNERTNPLNSHLFNLDGQKWKDMRSKLTPTFTSGKMKMMHQILVECSVQLEDFLRSNCKKGPLEIRDVMARYTTDVIGSAAFGLEMNSLKNPDAEFRKAGEEFFEHTFMNNLRQFAIFFIPHSILNLIGFRWMEKKVLDFFYNSIVSTVEYREKNNVTRKDFLNLLIQLKNSKNANDRLSVNEVAAQSFVFFVAGFETSSTTINFACHGLANNQDVQDKLRREINEVLEKHNNNITYEAVMEMDYLDRVFSETLRMYTPVGFLFRKCTKDYVIPGTSISIEKGTNIVIPAYGIHHDPEYYPNPEKFDPERFTEENMKGRPSTAYIPFGEGPRFCIGMRFGLHQAKMGLITLVRNYKITLNEKTRSPLVLGTSGFIMSPADGMWIDLEPVRA